MSTIEEKIGEPLGAKYSNYTDELSAEQWKAHLCALFDDAVGEWKVNHQSVFNHGLEQRFHRLHHDIPYVKNDKGVDVSRLMYFLGELEENPGQMDPGEIARNRIDIDRGSISDPDNLKRTAEYLEWNVRKNVNAFELASAEIDRSEYAAKIKRTITATEQMKTSCMEMIDWLCDRGLPPQKITCLFEPRGLSMTRDFGRGLDVDIGAAQGYGVGMNLREKDKLILLSTPSVYITRDNQADDEHDTEYGVRIADHKHHVSTGVYRIITPKAEFQVMVGLDGKLDQPGLNEVQETLVVRQAEVGSNDSYLAMDR